MVQCPQLNVSTLVQTFRGLAKQMLKKLLRNSFHHIGLKRLVLFLKNSRTKFECLVDQQKEGEVSLTVRSLLELEPLIRRIDNEIPECKLCGNVTIKVIAKYFPYLGTKYFNYISKIQGLLCPSCNAKFHHHCLAKFSKSGQSINKCPTCRQPWSNLDASTSSNGKEAQDTSMSNTSMRRGRKKRQIASDSDSD